MARYNLSNVAKEDLIRIHHYGINKFGITQADKYFDSFFEYFDMIAEQPFSFESVDFIKEGYSRCVCGSDSIYYRLNRGIVQIMAIIGTQIPGRQIVLPILFINIINAKLKGRQVRTNFIS